MRSRKFFITLWNKVHDKELDKEIDINLNQYVEELLKHYTLSYIIHDKEEEEKKHIHIYINNKNPISFDTLCSYNKYAHIEKVKGNDKQVFMYMQHKDNNSIEYGKIQYEEENIKGNYEYELTEKNQIGQNLINDIESGMTLWEIIQNNPTLWHSIDKIEKLYLIYQNYLYRKYDFMDLIEKEGKIIKRESDNNSNSNRNNNNSIT